MWASIKASTMMLFGDFLGRGFDHHDGFFGAGDDQIQLRFATLIVGRIDDVFAVDQPDAHAGDRVLERNVRKVKRARRAGDSDNVRIVVRIGRNNGGDDLRFKSIAVSETAGGPAGRSGGRSKLPFHSGGLRGENSFPECVRPRSSIRGIRP